METLRRAHRWLRRTALYIRTLIYTSITRRKIVIRETETAGGENGIFMVSFTASVFMPGLKRTLRSIRVIPENSKVYKVISAVNLAEEISRSNHFTTIPAIIEIDGDRVIVTIREN